MMAGTIAVAPDRRWSAAGWLFDWTLEFLAGRVTDPKVAAGLREIISENLGWVGLDDFGSEVAREIRALIQQDLVAAADQQLPADMAGRSEAMELLSELVSETSRQAGN
jgi:hypothetical protein